MRVRCGSVDCWRISNKSVIIRLCLAMPWRQYLWAKAVLEMTSWSDLSMCYIRFRSSNNVRQRSCDYFRTRIVRWLLYTFLLFTTKTWELCAPLGRFCRKSWGLQWIKTVDWQQDSAMGINDRWVTSFPVKTWGQEVDLFKPHPYLTTGIGVQTLVGFD